ncbi:response regulator [Pseudomonas sp. DD1]|uniref:response regulator n=1 Tax=Pseudomonas sp. DD1 TaxID=879558 RepID=UPI0037C54DD9
MNNSEGLTNQCILGAKIDHFRNLLLIARAITPADWNLPDAPGVNLLQRIRENDQDTPLIMITGRADRDSVLAVKSLKISAFFTKPFQVSRVVECLNVLLPLDEFPRTPTIKMRCYHYPHPCAEAVTQLRCAASFREVSEP